MKKLFSALLLFLCWYISAEQTYLINSQGKNFRIVNFSIKPVSVDIYGHENNESVPIGKVLINNGADKQFYSKTKYKQFSLKLNSDIEYELEEKRTDATIEVYFREKNPSYVEHPPVITPGTLIINKRELEWKFKEFINDHIYFENYDDDYVKYHFGFKIFCDKNDKWACIGNIIIKKDSSGSIRIPAAVEIRNSSYIAIVPVFSIYNDSDISFFEALAGGHGFSYKEVSSGNVSEKYFFYTVAGNDLNIKIEAPRDLDGAVILDEI
ncbi:MAG: hypothetical protein K6F69_06340 [Treponema sp.]|nr:hypothetical protein [Treponema sp.]